eukprot:7380591-Prymnesium_polylepis.1
MLAAALLTHAVTHPSCIDPLIRAPSNGLTQLTTVGAALFSISAHTIGDLGDYLRCTRMEPFNLSSGELMPVQYARLVFSIKLVANQAPTDVNFGLCLPASCTEAGILSLFEDFLPAELERGRLAVSSLSGGIDGLDSVIVDLSNGTAASNQSTALEAMAAMMLRDAEAMQPGSLQDTLRSASQLATEIASLPDAALPGSGVSLKHFAEGTVEQLVQQRAKLHGVVDSLAALESMKNLTEVQVVLGTQTTQALGHRRLRAHRDRPPRAARDRRHRRPLLQRPSPVRLDGEARVLDERPRPRRSASAELSRADRERRDRGHHEARRAR